MIAAEVAWNKAREIPGRDPEHDRQDKHGMPMWRERFNPLQIGGWAVNKLGDPEAFQVSGPPAMGDQPLSSVDASLYEAQHVKGALPIVATFSQQLTFSSAERLVFLGRQSTPNLPCIRLELHLGLGSDLDPVFCGRDVPDDGTLL